MKRREGSVIRCALAVIVCCVAAKSWALEPVPEKLVVLTFDDSVKSHFTVVRPILKEYKFGGTFFITEGFDFKINKKHYMTWEEIAQLHKDGFEIGNHTAGHVAVKPETIVDLEKQVRVIELRCKQFGIPRPTSFAYPGNKIHQDALEILTTLGMRFARRGGAPEYEYEQGNGFAYEPGLDHPLLIPSAGDARPDWTLADFKRAVRQATEGRIAVLQFHGVPDEAHPHVNTPPERFKQYMKYLKDNDYQVIALRDLARFVDPAVRPKDANGAIEDRKRAIKLGLSRSNTRKPATETELRYWLENMVWYHRFTEGEVSAATGLATEEVRSALKKFDINARTRPKRSAGAVLLAVPYPGGRHPRTGFLDGAIRPQRETKMSVFTPWDETSYVVLDVPEAIRLTNDRQRGLLYLAHRHVDTMWTKQGIELEKLEWQRRTDGSFVMERKLPNGVVFGTKVVPGKDDVRMEMWLQNGSKETLTGLRVQNCVMLKAAPEFDQSSLKDRVISEPYVAVKSARGDRWLINAWEPCERAWANPPCPCLHSDPRFPDCKPGETKRLRGWLSFYQGRDIEAELKRIDNVGWRGKTE